MSVKECLERALAANGAEVEEDIQAYIIGMVEEADDPTELRCHCSLLANAVYLTAQRSTLCATGRLPTAHCPLLPACRSSEGAERTDGRILQGGPCRAAGRG